MKQAGCPVCGKSHLLDNEGVQECARAHPKPITPAVVGTVRAPRGVPCVQVATCDDGDESETVGLRMRLFGPAYAHIKKPTKSIFGPMELPPLLPKKKVARG